MSQNFQYPNNQGGNANPANVGAKDNSTLKIVLIIFGVFAFVSLLVCGGLVALLLPAVNAAREAATRAKEAQLEADRQEETKNADQNNLRMIGLAFHNYESNYKMLPPPTANNSENVPVYGWSISLLPFLNENGIYQKIDWKNMQPWDSPAYADVFQAAPSVFQSVRAKHPAGSNSCNVFVIAAPEYVRGKAPLFVLGKTTRFAEAIDGLSNTIMAIQLAKHQVPWASPATLTADEAFNLIKNEDEFVNVLMSDSRVIAIPTTISRSAFDAMVTRNGQEPISVEDDGRVLSN